MHVVDTVNVLKACKDASHGGSTLVLGEGPWLRCCFLGEWLFGWFFPAIFDKFLDRSSVSIFNCEHDIITKFLNVHEADNILMSRQLL